MLVMFRADFFPFSFKIIDSSSTANIQMQLVEPRWKKKKCSKFKWNQTIFEGWLIEL